MNGLVGILLALGLLIYLAYRGVSVLILAPLMALVAAFFSGAPLLAGYTQIFMRALADFLALYFPLFLLGAVFGKLMEVSGTAGAIGRKLAARLGARHAILAIVAACAVLTYGGVSLFVVAFAAYPVAATLFREAGIPRRLIPATIALGAFTFTMTALPGTPAIQNAIPMPYFNTTPFAAPGLGIIGGVIMLAFGAAWLLWRSGAARRAGEGYGDEPDAGRPPPMKELREHAQGEGYDIAEVEPPVPAAPPSLVIALAPIVLVVALNYFFSTIVLPALEADYLSLPLYGQTSLDAVRGVWAIIAALTIAIVLLFALNWRRIARPRRALDDGAAASALPVLSTASLVGFGAVIASLPAFAAIREAVLSIAPGNPLVSLSIAVNLLAGITGSASGGMSIALQALGARYLEMGQAAAISPELLHRVTAIATGGLDALPHNGAVITLLSICRLTHRQAYFDMFAVAVLGPIAALIVVVVLGTLLGGF